MDMTYKYKFKNRILALTCLLSILTLLSCSNDEPNPSPYVKTKKTVLLVYAVATNSLSSNLIGDKNEILQGAQNVDLENNSILIFENTYNDGQRLLEVKKSGQDYIYDVVKQYDGSVSSLDPKRFSDVFNDLTENYDASRYGLILWSHSTASQPYLSNVSYSASGGSAEQLPLQYSFGTDNNASTSKYVKINVDELADIIPGGLFDYIWFDSCYMSNIETIYELRNKCNYFVGYPTEVWEFGLPYHLVLPYLMGDKPDLIKGAETFFNYYNNSNYPNATIAVVDMNKIESLAEFCSQYQPSEIPAVYNFIQYTRGSTGPFYDLGDYVKALARLNKVNILDSDWQNELNKCVIYKAATALDFNMKPIDAVRYSGISTHIYDPYNNSDTESYYKSLDWYQKVYTQ